ncbi:glycosyl hydrolase family 7-domain-containing protein [Ephemerocybe angulata]|uniref:Glucanase n=1 Tax=Ephemerocybe angulata TaxID=980116 RepID=A0A8H6I4C0_9AGAR|nr:glycosyl hydrolase family 7-domain-containing protein [Tulosesus angulatus]
MLALSVLLSLGFAATSLGQQVGNYTAETHPKLPWQECTRSGCTTKSNASITLDSNWRWVHITGNYTNCYTGNAWNTSICTSGASCTSKCALEGANYASTYGITTSGDALTLKFVTKGENTNIGSRVYLMESDSQVPDVQPAQQGVHLRRRCLSAPLWSQWRPLLRPDGCRWWNGEELRGTRQEPSTAQATATLSALADIKYINGEANVEGWNPSPNDTNAGVGGIRCLLC